MQNNVIDYILFARSIPEQSKKYGGTFSCSLGFSPKLQSLVRIYPIPLTHMKMWEMYQIEVEKNIRDSREESYKIGSKTKYENWSGFEKDIILVKKFKKQDVFSLISFFGLHTSTIDDLNKNKKSIGVIKIDSVRCYWNTNERFIDTSQLTLFNDINDELDTYTKDTKRYEARITFRSNNKVHDLQINEWGVYEFLRKFQGKYKVDDAFKYWNNASYLLIGNLHSHRNVWSVLNFF